MSFLFSWGWGAALDRVRYGDGLFDRLTGFDFSLHVFTKGFG